MELLSKRGLLLAVTALALAAWSPALRADDIGELFPGVKGVSGDELKRQIEEYDRTHSSSSGDTRRPAPPEIKPPPPPPAPPAPPAPEPPVIASLPKPVVAPPRAAPPASAVAATTNDSTATTAPSSAAKAAVARTGCLKKLADQTDFLEAYVKKAKVIRDNTRAEANQGNNSEAFNQYWLRYFPEQIDNGLVRAPGPIRYFHTLMLPATIYRYIYSMADAGIAAAKKVATADDVTPEDHKTADGLTKRLTLVRKDALLGAAEVYCLIRRLEVAGNLYSLLLKDYPSDEAIRASYEHFVMIRNQPKPHMAPHGPGE